MNAQLTPATREGMLPHDDPAPLRFDVVATEPELDEDGFLMSPGPTQLNVKKHADLDAALTQSTGASDQILADHFIKQLVATLPHNVAKDPNGVNAAIALLRGIRPKDELEGTLAIQMAAVHSAAIEMFRRATVEGQTMEVITEFINRAVKLTRTYTTQMEALTKYRNRGGQNITVQHVQVNDGGQAVVGNVNMRGRKRRKLV